MKQVCLSVSRSYGKDGILMNDIDIKFKPSQLSHDNGREKNGYRKNADVQELNSNISIFSYFIEIVVFINKSYGVNGRNTDRFSMNDLDITAAWLCDTYLAVRCIVCGIQPLHQGHRF